MLPKLLILIIIITFFNFHYLSSSQLVAAAAKCHPDDEAGLLAFKSGIKSDPSGLLLSWIPGTDCCSTWLGITCSQPLNRVTNLIFEPENSTQILSGTISPALSKLQYLEKIGLFNLRNLSGPFPSFLFNLPRLTVVFIGNNKLSGILPENIGTRLPSKLEYFTVEGNKFSGTIPTSFNQLTHLILLSLSGNMFTGSIPYTIGNLNNLSRLALDRNQLTGTIPDTFKRLTNLQYFNVSHNKLSGNIPEFLGTLDGLERLDLSWNQFQGTVPKNFANLTKISRLGLSHNSLVDPFPVLKVNNIELLDLSYNQFHLGQIPTWVTSSLIIYSLKLAKCGIKIKLDEWNPIETFYYESIDLSENEITGSPVHILNRTGNIVEFYASGNKLNFNLESLNFSQTLKFLDLSRNMVFGKVPKAVSGLHKLNVSNNHLCGQLPKTNFPASAFVENDCLCGSPLPQCKA